MKNKLRLARFPHAPSTSTDPSFIALSPIILSALFKIVV